MTQTTPVSHAEAHQIASRFIAGHFNNGVASLDHPRISIPADPEHDDDIRLLAYIDQQMTQPTKSPDAAPSLGAKDCHKTGAAWQRTPAR